jgi:predicted TIM-barrel fold metal-dependent hydrolase
VDKIAVDFREINFIMAHVGTPWIEEALAVAMKNTNVYVDLSAWQPAHALFPLRLAQVLSQAKLMHGGVHKVLFGSDWPLLTEIYTQKQWVEVIKSMDYPAPLQIMGLPEITDADKEMILGTNAQKVLNL